MGVPRRNTTSRTGRSPSSSFLKVDRPDIEEIEIRTNWLNPAAIAMVTKKQRGNSIHITILWICGKSTQIEGQAATLFLEKWTGEECQH